MPITWQAEDTTEPIADTTIEGIANFQNYSTVSGCAATYNGATMVVAIAAGSVLHNGSVVTVAGNNVTLVSDATHPRWTWIGISSVGVATIISGTPAAAPTVPELGDFVCSQLVLVQANLTIATNATAKLDKRVIYTPTKTVLTTTGDSLYASGANTEARLAIGTTNQALTVVAGVPAWRASATSVLTTTADVLYASAANVLARLGIGSTGQALTVFGGLPAWRASATSALTTTGDVLYASAANTLARLGIGSAGQVITVAGGVPTWATPASPAWSVVTSGTYQAYWPTTSFTVSGITGYTRYLIYVSWKAYSGPTPYLSINGNVGASEYSTSATAFHYETGTAVVAGTVNAGYISTGNTNGILSGFLIAQFFPAPNTNADPTAGNLLYQVTTNNGLAGGATTNSTALSSFTVASLGGSQTYMSSAARYVVYGAA